jgi:hypothetical protein
VRADDGRLWMAPYILILELFGFKVEEGEKG